MHDTSLEGRQDNLTRALLGRFDVPAYVRRARGVQDAQEALLARCRLQRRQWAARVRARLADLVAADGWPALVDTLGETTTGILRALWDELSPKERAPGRTPLSLGRRRRLLNEIVAEVRALNGRVQAHLEQVDLAPLNALRDGYNRYYVLEKECALRSPQLALLGFHPLAPLKAADLKHLLPALPVPDPATWG